MPDLVLYNTDQLRDLYLRDFKLRMPDALTSRGTAPYIDATTVAGLGPALFKNASIAADRALISRTFGAELDTLANDRHQPRSPGTGSFASVIVSTTVTGATIPIGTIGKHSDTGESFQTTSATAVYLNGATIGVKSVGLGRQTNVSGTIIWQSPPAGLSPEAKIVGSAVGGTDIELDADLQQRLQAANDPPPADDNNGEYLQLIRSTEHGVPVDQAFIYPAILGAGTIGITCTIRGEGAARFPTAPQLSAIETYVKARVPADDGIFMFAVSAQPTGTGRTPIIGIKFITGETGFVDQDPFPKYNVPVGVTQWTIGATPSPTATTFQVVSSNGTYSGSGIRNGQTIALWDPTTYKFVNKRILSFTGTGPYVITCDSAASNTTYIPVIGQGVSPWSDKINAIAQTVVDYYNSISPGENTNWLPDPGGRMRRFPPDSIKYPYGVTSRVTDGIADRTDIQNVTVLSGLTNAPNAGTPGVNVFMILLQDLTIYGILFQYIMAQIPKFNQNPSTRPTYADFGSGDKINDPLYPPNPITMPTAPEYNEMGGSVAAVCNMSDLATIIMTHSAGTYSKVAGKAINSNFILGGTLATGDVVITKNGVGDLTFQFAVGIIPTIVFPPIVSFNHTSALGRVSNNQVVDGRTVRIRILESSTLNPAEALFTLYVK
jgi:uncharacterized phage protein gp47/JayE